MIKAILVLSTAAALLSPAWAVNKCTDAQGRVSFQDKACPGQGEAIEVKPATGPISRSAPAPAPRQSKEGAFGESWQRRMYLEERGIPEALQALNDSQAQCDQVQNSAPTLLNRRSLTVSNLNNPDGNQAAVSDTPKPDLQAVSSMCASRQKELRTQLESLEKELRGLQSKR